jgi:hypothetical protein
MLRVDVFYGQGGVMTSGGMAALANRVYAIDEVLSVSAHGWADYHEVAASIGREPPETKIVEIGYSLGANAVTWLAGGAYGARKPRRVDLMILYDPTVGLHLGPWVLVPASVSPIGDNVARALLYHNSGPAVWGKAIPSGMTEQIDVWTPHELLDWDERLHQRTLAEIRALL